MALLLLLLLLLLQRIISLFASQTRFTIDIYNTVAVKTLCRAMPSPAHAMGVAPPQTQNAKAFSTPALAVSEMMCVKGLVVRICMRDTMLAMNPSMPVITRPITKGAVNSA